MLQNEKEIIQKLSDFQSLADGIPAHIYWKNNQGIYLGCNQEQAKTLGIDITKIKGAKAHEITTRENAENILKADNYVLTSGRSVITEETDENGNAFISVKVPLNNKSNNVLGMLGLSFNITERVKKELDREVLLTQNKAALEAILASLPGHVYWMDSNQVFLGCNEAQAKTLGLSSRKEIVGKTNFDFKHKVHASKIYGNNQAVIETKKETEVEEKGFDRVYQTKKAPLFGTNDEVIGLVGVSLDITDKKKAEALESENKRNKEKAEDTKQLAVKIAHQMRSPIGSTVMQSQNMLLDFDERIKKLKRQNSSPLLQDELNFLGLQRENLSQLLDTISLAGNTINVLLKKVGYSSLTTEQNKKISISECVDSVLHRFPFKADEKSKVTFKKGHDFEFLGSYLAVDHILSNLLENALYFIREQEGASIKIWLECGEDFNTLFFKDTGPGMSNEVLSKIFRFGTSGKKNNDGTGVGLAFSKERIEELGGKIECKSTEGEYTLFEVKFPTL